MRARTASGFRKTRSRDVVSRLIFALLCAVFSGCANGLATVGPMQGDVVIAIERANGVPPGSLYLKPVPGGLLGKTVDSELFRSRTGAENVRVSAVVLATRADTHAQMTRSDRFNPGELASPRELGIARIGTFYEPANRTAGCSNFRTGLDLEMPGSAMLIYVDRPGTVHGTRYSQPWIMDYRLEFPAAGIYVVTSQARGPVVTQRLVDIPERLAISVRRTSCD